MTVPPIPGYRRGLEHPEALSRPLRGRLQPLRLQPASWNRSSRSRPTAPTASSDSTTTSRRRHPRQLVPEAIRTSISRESRESYVEGGLFYPGREAVTTIPTPSGKSPRPPSCARNGRRSARSPSGSPTGSKPSTPSATARSGSRGNTWWTIPARPRFRSTSAWMGKASPTISSRAPTATPWMASRPMPTGTRWAASSPPSRTRAGASTPARTPTAPYWDSIPGTLMQRIKEVQRHLLPAVVPGQLLHGRKLGRVRKDESAIGAIRGEIVVESRALGGARCIPPRLRPIIGTCIDSPAPWPARLARPAAASRAALLGPVGHPICRPRCAWPGRLRLGSRPIPRANGPRGSPTIAARTGTGRGPS